MKTVLKVPHVKRVWSVIFEELEVALPDRVFNKTQHEWTDFAFRYLAVQETTRRYTRGRLRRPRDNPTTTANL